MITNEAARRAIYYLETGEGGPEVLTNSVVDKLIEFGMIERDLLGNPRLTNKGHSAYTTFESGAGGVPELDALPRK